MVVGKKDCRLYIYTKANIYNIGGSVRSVTFVETVKKSIVKYQGTFMSSDVNFHRNRKGRLMSIMKIHFCPFHMSHFSYACKMRYPLNLVLESWEYLWFYLTFWVVLADGD